MNNIVDNIDQILKFAQGYGLPLANKRAILREYLQIKVLEIIYQAKVSKDLFFVGGTSLRLLRNLDRFSEDLDFDTLNISKSQVENLMKSLHSRLIRENITVDFYQNVTSRRIHYELRFKDLLFQLGISRHQEEKLVVKFDFEKFWQGLIRESVLLNRYGHLANIITLSLNQILVQKLFAYLHRQQTLPRDLYDIIWLAAQETKLDRKFLQKNNLPNDLITKAQEKFQKEKNQLRNFKIKLRPFLIQEENVEKLEFFLQVLDILQIQD